MLLYIYLQEKYVFDFFSENIDLRTGILIYLKRKKKGIYQDYLKQQFKVTVSTNHTTAS